LQLVGEASDELAALRKAQELKPEIMLLDIRLPELNGFEVARQIREHTPQRISFEPLKPLSHKLSTPSSAPESRLRNRWWRVG
jgi:CheY-like chemotaxis protein